jgi:hypothetical protein
MSQRLLPVLLVLVNGTLVPGVFAAEPVPEFSASDPSCACIAQGKRWSQGEEVCLAGLRMICGMNQNISTWKSLGQSCQVSSLSRVNLNFTPM